MNKEATWSDLPDIPPEKLAPQAVNASYWLSPGQFDTGIWDLPYMQLVLLFGGTIRHRAWDAAGGIATGTAGDGQVLAFYPGRLQYESVGSVPVKFYHVCMVWSNPPLESGIPTLPGVGRLPRVLTMGERKSDLAAVCDRLISTLVSMGPTWRLAASSALLELLHLMFSAAEHVTAAPERRVSPWDVLLTRLESETAMPPVGQLAREMGMSVNHFIRMFRLHTGNTPKQYVLTRRLWKARALLKEGATVKEAAARCGFKDPLYFSRLYSHLFQTAPSLTSKGPATADAYARSGMPICRHLWAPPFGSHSARYCGSVPL